MNTSLIYNDPLTLLMLQYPIFRYIVAALFILIIIILIAIAITIIKMFIEL